MLDSVAFFSTCFERKRRHPCSDGWNGRRSVGRPFPSSHRLTERVGNRSAERHSHRQSWRHCNGPAKRNVHRSAECHILRSVERKDRHSAECHSHRPAERNNKMFAHSFHKLFDRRVRISLLSDALRPTCLLAGWRGSGALVDTFACLWYFLKLAMCTLFYNFLITAGSGLQRYWGHSIVSRFCKFQNMGEKVFGGSFLSYRSKYLHFITRV